MYIFSRTRTIDPGRMTEAIAGAVEVSGKVNEVVDLTVTTWFQRYAPTGPAAIWTVRFDHLEDLDKADEAFMASTEIQDLVAELDESFTGPMVDNVFEVVGGTLPATAAPVVSTVQAAAANGHLRAAMHWGSDLAERFTTSMNVPTIFARGLHGQYGTVIWASYFDDINAFEGTMAKLAADEMLQAVMDEGAHNCQPGALSTMMRRLD